jgi:molecular chaperone DnaJ
MIRSSHHAALGLDDYERAEAIQGAYRDLARRYHPAHVGAGGEENFRIVGAAYRALCDSPHRRSYANSRLRGDAGVAQREPRPTSEFSPVGARGPRPPVHVDTLSLDRAAILASRNGDAMLARFARNFSGVGVPKSESAECLHIRFVVAARDRAGDVVLNLGLPVLTLCHACAGHCVTARVQCPTCNGGGFVESERIIALTFSAASANVPRDLSLAPLGIHNFYLQAVVQIDRTFN